MRVSFDLAMPEDDAAIRELLASCPMPGLATLTYEREPNYFLGCDVVGRQCQTLVARTGDGEIVAVAVRASRQRFVNGAAEEIGYLSGLRVHPRYRGRWVIPPGFRSMRDLHEADGQVKAYLITIVDENRVARDLLVKRAWRDFPILHPIDQIQTLAIILRRPRLVHRRRSMRSARPSITLERGSRGTLGEIVAFLREHGVQRQLFPVYCQDDFAPESAVTRGFQIKDFIVARRYGRVVGTIGLWDQSSYKQTVVRGYEGILKARPVYNLGARLLGAQPLPEPGTAIHHAFAAFICVADDQRSVFQALLKELVDLAASRGYGYLMLGLSRRDPLLAVARRYPHVTYRSTAYIATWKDGEGFHERFDHRVPYIEIATL